MGRETGGNIGSNPIGGRTIEIIPARGGFTKGGGVSQKAALGRIVVRGGILKRLAMQ